jgi:hypothetical protein
MSSSPTAVLERPDSHATDDDWIEVATFVPKVSNADIDRFLTWVSARAQRVAEAGQPAWLPSEK